jgi:hypothetical protein
VRCEESSRPLMTSRASQQEKEIIQKQEIPFVQSSTVPEDRGAMRVRSAVGKEGPPIRREILGHGVPP